jgi:hypothetical protein
MKRNTPKVVDPYFGKPHFCWFVYGTLETRPKRNETTINLYILKARRQPSCASLVLLVLMVIIEMRGHREILVQEYPLKMPFYYYEIVRDGEV